MSLEQFSAVEPGLEQLRPDLNCSKPRSELELDAILAVAGADGGNTIDFVELQAAGADPGAAEPAAAPWADVVAALEGTVSGIQQRQVRGHRVFVMICEHRMVRDKCECGSWSAARTLISYARAAP